MAKKAVKASMKVIEKPAKKGIKPTQPAGVNETHNVNEFMRELVHPLNAEIEAVRTIIKNSNSAISERIKWNAPSFFYKEDFLTIHVKATKCVHLIFHHPGIVNIKSPILEGDYKDRRMVYLYSMEEIKGKKSELERIMNRLVDHQNK